MVDTRRGKRKEIVIFSPVGDLGQLDGFCHHVKRMGMDKDADFAFIYRKGLQYKECGLSSVQATEKYPLGTSGCFFAGQVMAYRLGYPIIVVTDLDALLDSRKTLMEMISIARREGKVVSPVSANAENPGVSGASNMNQWSVFPRHVFETVGFSIPFFWRGGDDYELLWRYKSLGKTAVYRQGHALHPISGHTVFHKMLERKKQYPYVASLLKALLYMKEYQPAAERKFIFWYAYYSYFSDVFGDGGLRKVLKASGKFVRPVVDESRPALFEIRQGKRCGKFEGWSPKMLASTLASPFLLALFGEYCIYRDRVVLKAPRMTIFCRGIAACALAPFRLLEAFMVIAAWDDDKGRLRGLDMRASNAVLVEKEFEKFLKDKKLAV